MSFASELAAATRRERAFLLASPVIGEEPSGRVSRDRYLSFLMQAHCHVSQTIAVPAAAAAGLPPQHQQLREAALAYGRELVARADRLVADLASLGVDVCPSSIDAPAPATAALISFAQGIAVPGNGVGLLGLMFVAEGTVASLAAIAADRIALALDLPRSSLGYLIRNHQALDPANARWMDGLLHSITDRDDRGTVIRSAKSVFGFYAGVLRWPAPSEPRRADLPARQRRSPGPAVRQGPPVAVPRW